MPEEKNEKTKKPKHTQINAKIRQNRLGITLPIYFHPPLQRAFIQDNF